MGREEGSDAPLVSVVIPTYERPDLLGDAVKSALDQTYESIEILVVNDGSATPAETAVADITALPKTDMTFLRHNENRGANAARNTGAKAANGDLVAFLDDDDYWHPEKIERQVTALEQAPDDVGVVFTGQLCVDETGSVTNTSHPVTDGNFIENLAEGATFGTFSAVMVRADVFQQAGYPDERFPCWQDREWYFRLADHYNFVSIPEALTIRRFIDTPQISDRFEARRDIAYPLMLEKHRQRVSKLGEQYERTFLMSLSTGVASSALHSERYLDAVRYFLKAIRYRPTTASLYAYLFVALGGKYTYKPAQALKQALNRVHHQVSDTPDQSLQLYHTGSDHDC